MQEYADIYLLQSHCTERIVEYLEESVRVERIIVFRNNDA